MPKVEHTHRDYDKRLPQWIKVRDCIEGEDAIKAKKTDYLPKLSGHSTDGPGNYNAYLMRASFLGAAGRTVESLEGMVMRKDPDMTWPEGRLDILKTIGRKNETWDELQDLALEENLGPGRYGMLVDSPTTDPGEPKPFIATYFAENITDWEDDEIDGRREPILITLREVFTIETDQGEVKPLTRYRRLMLGVPMPETQEEMELTIEEFITLVGLKVTDFNEGPVYFQEIWEEDPDAEDSQSKFVRVAIVVPRMFGGRLIRRIPFTTFNPSQPGLKPEKPSILALVNINLSHYRNSADLEHGRHFTALPQAWASGFSFDAKEVWIGSGTAWVTENVGAKAGYLEFTGAGLGHLKEGMDDKAKQMAALGARLLEEAPTQPEAAETVRLRHSGEQSVLSKISQSTSDGLTKVLGTLAEWLAIPGEVGVTLNKDFNILGITPQMLQAQMLLVQSGMLSWNALFWNMKRGEIIPDGISEDDEAARILAGPPGMELPPSQLEEDDEDAQTANEEDTDE